MTTAPAPLSGVQFSLRSGAYDAVIASVGATLRELRHDGRDLVVPFEADQVRPDYRGATLAPWPNRIVDGEYEFDGEELVTALTEPDGRTRFTGSSRGSTSPRSSAPTAA